MVVEMSMQWNDSYQEHVLCFTNNTPKGWWNTSNSNENSNNEDY